MASILLFCSLLAFHVWGAAVGWENLNLPGVEFRQTQTAISTYYIQKDHDFSLAYPTPVLGKPWSVPMEFPLYQWAVVIVSNATGLDLTKSGRVVSLACFYLTLPAVFLLLGQWITVKRWRFLVLSAIISSPFYIYYGRAFLMESMALMASVWFLLGYVRGVQTGGKGWLLAATIFGSVAGLVKVTTFILFLGPAAGWTFWLLLQRRRKGGGPEGMQPSPVMTVTRAAVATFVPFGLTLAWIRFADATKALNPASEFLQSSAMVNYHFGTAQTRFSPEIWRGHWQIMTEMVLWLPLLITAGVLAIFFVRQRWRQVAVCLGCFVGIQILFPVLYALHEYYYIANGLFLFVAIGLVLVEMLESRLPRAVTWLVAAGFLVVHAWSYFLIQYPLQKAPSTGGSPITQALRVATEPDDVLIVAGQDWCSNTPYFAQRRALMFRTGIENDSSLIEKYFDKLSGEKVGALVLAGQQRDNRELLDRVVRNFGIDPRPVFTSLDATVYFHRRLRLAAIPLVKTVADAQSVQLTAESIADDHALLGHELELAQLPESYRKKFDGMSPLPFKYFTTYGLERHQVENRDMFFAHPVTRLWFKVPAGKHAMLVEAQLTPAAYTDSLPVGDRSDGFGLKVSVETPGGTRREILYQRINPRDRPEDRGLKSFSEEFDLAEGEVVLVETDPGPHQNLSRDWALLGRLEIK